MYKETWVIYINNTYLIYLTDNNSYVEFVEPINISDVSFNIEILSNINSVINLKIQLSSELIPKNFFGGTSL